MELDKKILDFIQKQEKIYVGSRKQVPPGREVHKGPRGGTFYYVGEKAKSEHIEIESIKKHLLPKLYQLFKKNKYELFEVGGSVRDELMGRKSEDIDLTSNARPEEIKRLLEESGMGSVFTVGKEFGTIGLNLKDIKIEITTYRDEVYASESRKPTVRFGKDLLKDLARRDFTINDIARNPLSGELIDPFNGERDIKEGVIRCVGDDSRLEEDPLRMLRAVRFACRLGFQMRLKMAHPERLQIISKERIQDEFVKILMTQYPAWGVDEMVKRGLMKNIIPEVLELRNIEQGRHHFKDAYGHTLLVLDKTKGFDFGPRENAILRLAALLHDIAKPLTKTESDGEVHFYNHQAIGAQMVKEILPRLKFDSETTKRVANLVHWHMSFITLEDKQINRRNILRLINRVGRPDIYLELALVTCDTQSHNVVNHERLARLRTDIDEALKVQPEPPDSPLSGEDIMALFGIKPGKPVGQVKDYLKNLVSSGELAQEDKAAAVERAKAYWERKK